MGESPERFAEAVREDAGAFVPGQFSHTPDGGRKLTGVLRNGKRVEHADSDAEAPRQIELLVEGQRHWEELLQVACGGAPVE